MLIDPLDAPTVFPRDTGRHGQRGMSYWEEKDKIYYLREKEQDLADTNKIKWMDHNFGQPFSEEAWL